MKNKKTMIILGLILVFSMIVRFVFEIQFNSTPYHGRIVSGGDSVYYLNWAKQLLIGNDPIKGAFFMSPLYPYFLKFVFMFLGTKVIVVRIIQHILGLLTILLTFLIGKHIKDNRTGMLAAIILALSAVPLLYEGLLLLATLLLFLNTLFLYLFLRFSENSLLFGSFLPGFIIGVIAIGRGNVLLFIPILIIWILFHSNKENIKFSLQKILLFLFGLSLVLLPVTLRNLNKEHSFVLLTTNLGLNFYIGNNHNAKGTYDLPDEIRFIPGELNEDIQGRKYAENKLKRHLTSMEVSKYWFDRGMNFWHKEPWKAFKTYLRKIQFFWCDSEIPQIENFYFFRSEYLSILWLGFISFGMLAPISIAGCFAGFKKKDTQFIALFLIVYSLSLSLFFITARYRLPIFSFLAVIFAWTISYLIEIISEKKKLQTLFMAGIILLSIVTFKVRPFDMNYTYAQQFNQIGFLFFKNSDYKQAEKQYKKAIEKDPSFPTAYRNLGDIYQITGKNNKALEMYEEALKRNPEDSVTFFNCGHLYQKKGNIEDAEKCYNAAIRLDVSFSMAYNNLALIREKKKAIKEALQLYQQALKWDDTNHQAYNNLGRLVLSLGMIDEAIKLFKRASQEAPNEVRYRLNLAVTYAKIGKYSLSNKELNTILNNFNKNLSLEKQVVILLLNNYEKREDYQQILLVGNKYLKKYPNNVKIKSLVDYAELHIKD